MIISIFLNGPKLAHLNQHQMGAFVAHVYKMERFHSVECFKFPSVRVNFEYEGLSETSAEGAIQLQKKLQSELDALADLDPMPCPCGCGAFIAISACLRQSGQMIELIGGLAPEEFALARAGNKIGAIKLARERTGLGLREAKDLVDRSGAYPYPAQY